MRLWLRGPVRLAQRSGRGLSTPRGRPPPLPAPREIVAAWEAINLDTKPVPEHFNFAHDVVDTWAQLEKAGHRPPNPAFWWVNSQKAEVKWNFQELGVQSKKAANVLGGACGLRPGDRMILVLPRIPEWWLVSLACMRAGVVMIPGISQLTEKDLKYRLQASGAKSIITSDSLAPRVDAIHADCPSLQTRLLVSDRSRPGWMNFRKLLREASAEHSCVRTRSQDPQIILFTSGTTGAPKMVEHSHVSYGLGLIATGRQWLDLAESDTFWCTTDTGWVKAAWSFFTAWPCGACLFVHEMPRVDAKVILKTLTSFPITTLCCVSTIFRLLIQEDLTRYQFQSLRHCVSGGEPVNPDVREKWKSQTGLELHEGYGQTETALLCANVKGTEIKAGSMGKAFPPYDMQVVDDAGSILPPGQEGNLAVRIRPERPFCMFRHYVDNPKKTAESERGDFYITGDRGYRDQDGYFWFLGRRDDVINSSSYRIGPFEVESALAEHPAVQESAVVSSPDPLRGEVVKAFIVLSPTYSSRDPEELTRELQDHVKRVTAPYKYPRKVAFVSELPKTVSGKIWRAMLRSQEWRDEKRPQKGPPSP